jgi:hypothetical protein
MAGNLKTGRFSPVTRALAAVACLSMTATPVLAGDRGGHHRRHHDGGVDAGDIFAGLLILGGIAAIASAASSDKDKSRDDEYRYRTPEPEGRGWQQPQGWGAGQAMNDAVASCARAAGREDEVSDIYGAQRTGDGYQVSGQLANGRDFACTTGSGGEVRDLIIDGREVVSAGQGYDDRYDAAASPDFEDSTGG